MSLSLRNGAALLAAKAVLNAYPKAEMLASGASDLGFCCSFLSSEELALPVIEEQLRSLLTEHEPFQFHEMVPAVAEEWLKSKKQFERAKQLKGRRGLVTLVRIGDFLDIVEPPLAEEGLKWTQLLRLRQEGEVVHLEGVVFESRDQLKEFMKAYKGVPEKRPLLASLPGCREEGILSPEGVLFEERLYASWRAFIEEMGATLVKSPYEVGRERPLIPAYQHALLLKEYPTVAEWRSLELELSDEQFSREGRPRRFSQDFIHTSSSKEHLNSSLHFLVRWIKILELKGKWLLRAPDLNGAALKKAANELNISFEETADRAILDPVSFSGPRLEFVFVDQLQREWVGPYVGVWKSSGRDELISLSLLGSFNRTLFAATLSGGLRKNVIDSDR